ncbi:MAG: response regulator [Deltaproteobacteria bacterium]|uniref:Response regulator n=1 Tax=Candidatus Zymogenus saltonus TaxID=2844893 RepID=A0A9D8KGU9_9DELT|nr:response regulator [Candidatus Zymogenus saltonus]
MDAKENKDRKLVMKGVLSVLSLPGLIQTINTRKKVQIVLKPEAQKKGSLYFQDGKIIYASVGDVIFGKKAFFRMMGWIDIPFEMFELANFSKDIEPNIDMDTNELILDGTRHLDETHQLETKLPLYYKIRPGDTKGLDLTDNERKILEIIGPQDFVKNILNRSNSDDLSIYRLLVQLYEKNAISLLRTKMLIIDDNRFFADIINDVVDKIFKNLFVTHVVDTGEKGIAIIEGPSKPDLILSDLIMEGKDGFDVIESAKKNSIPIIILTSERRDKDKITATGAEYMHKSVLGTDEFTDFFKKVLFKILTIDH